MLWPRHPRPRDLHPRWHIRDHCAIYLAVFSQIIAPETPLSWKIIDGLTCAVLCAGWFTIVACILNQKHIRAQFLRASKWLDRICGAVLIALGVKVALSQK